MALPSQPGRYIARPRDWTVKDEGPGKPVTFVCSYDLLQFFHDGSWVQVSDLGITGYHYVIKKDGTGNEMTIKALRDSLGWYGNISALANTNWSDAEVQLTLKQEEYQGKPQIKVGFINPRDYVPGVVEHSDPQTIQSLDAKYGSMLRAMGQTGNPPAKSSNGAAKPAAPTPADPVKVARMAAWEAFRVEHPGKGNEELTEPWRAMIKSVIADRASTTFTADDWKKIQNAIEYPVEVNAPPFGDEKQFKEDDIPFDLARQM